MSKLKITDSHIGLLEEIGRDIMYCLHMSFDDLMSCINEDGDNYVLVGSVSKNDSSFEVSEISEIEWDYDDYKINWVRAVPVAQLPSSIFV